MFLTFIVLITGGCPRDPEGPERPNLVFIITDDQGYGDLSLHGNPILETPNLDAIGREGVRLDNFHVSPVCAPTRAAFLTGRRPMSTGVFWVTRGAEIMDAEEYTLAEVLKDNGYATGCFGKWHNGVHPPFHPKGQGFDEFFGFTAGHWNNYFDPVLEDNGRMERQEGYIADIFTDRAIRFIHERKDESFFCYLAYNTPHSPFQVPDEYFDLYIDKIAESDSALRVINATVYGMVRNIDDNVGRLVGSLEDLGLVENTILIFTTDNGPNSWRYNAGMKGRKGWVNDGGVRVPFFNRWPGQIPGGRTEPAMAAHIDLLPTLVDLLDLEFTPVREIHGKSLAGLIRGKNPEEDRFLFSHQNHGTVIRPLPGAVRSEKWRLVLNRNGSRELTLRSDAVENNNLLEKNTKLADSLEAAYHEWFKPFYNLRIHSIPVGLADSSRLPANEGHLRGTAAYNRSPAGYSHDWVKSLDGDEASVHWNLDVRSGGLYACVAVCTSPAGKSTLNLAFEGKAMEAELPPFVPQREPAFNRYNRPGDYINQSWQRIRLGRIRLDAGQMQLVLKASDPETEILELILVRSADHERSEMTSR